MYLTYLSVKKKDREVQYFNLLLPTSIDNMLHHRALGTAVLAFKVS